MKKKHTVTGTPVQSAHRIKKADDMWILKLYVAEHDSHSVLAFSHLKKICETHLKGRYRIVIVDLLKNPHLGFEDQILSLPALVRTLPLAVKNIIGYLLDTERVLIGLNQLPAQSN